MQRSSQRKSSFINPSQFYTNVLISSRGKNTINAQYMINPDTNKGVDYQFDEVVRNKRERQHMDATDCECCREASILRLLHIFNRSNVVE
jgi:hypothetical protein